MDLIKFQIDEVFYPFHYYNDSGKIRIIFHRTKVFGSEKRKEMYLMQKSAHPTSGDTQLTQVSHIVTNTVPQHHSTKQLSYSLVCSLFYSCYLFIGTSAYR